MSPSSPFLDDDQWTIDFGEVLHEAIPLAVLIGVVGIVVAIPFVVLVTVGIAPLVLTLITQFLLAVGTGIILLYIIARAIHLSNR